MRGVLRDRALVINEEHPLFSRRTRVIASRVTWGASWLGAVVLLAAACSVYDSSLTQRPSRRSDVSANVPAEAGGTTSTGGTTGDSAGGASGVTESGGADVGGSGA